MEEENKSLYQKVQEKLNENEQKIENAIVPLRALPVSARTNAIIHMYAMGAKQKDIALKLNLSVARIQAILASEGAKKEVSRIQKEIFYDDPKAAFQAMIPNALKAHKRLLKPSAKEASQLGALKEVYERTWGKAVQPIEHGGSGIKELLMALDKKNRPEEQKAHSGDGSEPIEADFKEISSEKPKDDLDQWLDANDF